MAKIPSASEIEMDVVEVDVQDESVDLDSLVKSVKALSPSDWIKLIKSTVTDMDKKLKSLSTSKSGRTKKAGSAPKGETPKQLRKTHAWVKYTLQHALQNGWPTFPVENKKTSEVIQMAASIFHDGAHVYEDSITTETPAGKQIIHKDAMSLSKYYKLNHPEIYHQFETKFEEEQEDEESSEDEKKEAQPVVKKTAAQKAAERKAQSDAKKEAAAAAKAEAAAKKKEAAEAKKKAAAEAKKQAADQKKAAKAEEKAKESPKKAVKSPIKAAAISEAPSSSSSSSSTTASTAVKKVAPKKLTKVQAADAEPHWECPDDDGVYPWTWKTGGGKDYFRNHSNEVWEKGADGGLGKWVGLYDPITNKMDTDAPEPVFEDDE
jgi:flagellar biosynthesis GTPase FlhF